MRADHAPTQIDICQSCGVVRAVRKPKCPRCRTAYEGRATAAREGDVRWVCIECTFRCRACGFDVPLNHLDMDGGVLCVRCGLEQAFDVVQWRKALAHAHDTGESWEGTDVGEQKSSVVLEGIGENELKVTASPGHPLCDACHRPLDVTFEGETKTGCACGASASYALPAAAKKIARGLRALIAAEHRADRKPVKVDETASAIAVVCPSCNAPLEPDESSKFLTCAFCKTTSRIPDRTWFRLSKQDPVALQMWLLFEGPSPRRQEEAAEVARASKSREQKERAAQERKRAAAEREEGREEQRRESPEELKARHARDAAERERIEALRRKKKDTPGWIIALATVAILAIGVLVWMFER